MTDTPHIRVEFPVEADGTGFANGLDLARQFMTRAYALVLPYVSGDEALAKRVFEQIGREFLVDIEERAANIGSDFVHTGDFEDIAQRFEAHRRNQQGEVERLLLNYFRAKIDSAVPGE